MNDLVSVIVPAFDRCTLIGQALDSILGQTYKHWEAVVVDDASTDGTAQIVEEYSRIEPRIRLVRHGQRKGAQAARNTGIRVARGIWIAFLDSDDWWLPASLEMRLQALAEKKVSVVHSECYVLRPGSQELQRFGVPPMQGQVYRELLRRPGPMFQGLLISRELLTRFGHLDERIVSHQEWDTAIRLAKYSEFGFLPEPTFIYDCRHKGTISEDSVLIATGYARVVRKHWRSILLYCGPVALSSHAYTIAGLCRRTDDRRNALLYFSLALLLWPFRPGALLRRAQGFFRPRDQV